MSVSHISSIPIEDIVLKFKNSSISDEELNCLLDPDILAAEYEGIYLANYFFHYIIRSNNFSEDIKWKFRKIMSDFIPQNVKLARSAAIAGDYELALLCEEWLLSTNIHSDSATNFDILIEELIANNQQNLLLKITPTGRLLAFRSLILNGSTIIEYFLNNFRYQFDFTSISTEAWRYKMEDGSTLLEYMIKKDKEFISELITPQMYHVFGHEDILPILNANNISPHIDTSYFIAEYSKEQKQSGQTFQIYSNAQTLIDEFRSLMLEDGQSDVEMVDVVCNWFKNQIAKNRPYAIRDLQAFITIKSNWPEFNIKKITEQSKEEYPSISYPQFFRQGSPDFFVIAATLWIDSSCNDDVIAHEMTHALHFFSSNFQYPASFRRDEASTEIVGKISNFMMNWDIKYREILDNTDSIIDKHTINSSCYQNYLRQMSYELKKALINQPLSQEHIDFFSAITLNRDDFITALKRDNKGQLAFNIFRVHYEPVIELIGLFDALFQGLVVKLKNSNNEPFDFFVGHSEEYYQKDSNKAFSEIIAHYGSIIKSSQAEELIAVLVDIMGNDFVNMLDEFYASMNINTKRHMMMAA